MVTRGAWNGRFFEADPRFWPIAPAARRFAEHPDWPAPEELEAPGVRFVTAHKPRRARRGTSDPTTGYDARVLAGEVPTRPRSWHDFLNALVWVTFPESKRRLPARQAEAIRSAVAPGARGLPNARTREQDALALLDEGGVVVLRGRDATLTLGFGHALYEALVTCGPNVTASALSFELEQLPEPSAARGLADRLLAERLCGPLVPETLERRPF